MKERLKRMLFGAPPPSRSSPRRPVSTARDASPASIEKPSQENAYRRSSHGLDQFFSHIADQAGLSILDLAGITQANVAFITNLGHRLYSEDFLRTLFDTFEADGEELLTGEPEPERVSHFLGQNLDFPEKSFDAVLVWDVLEFLPQPLLKATIDRLFKIAKPGCHLLAFFHADEKSGAIPVYAYRIADSKSLVLTHRGVRRPVQFFNNRGIEKLFQRFNSVKFFLTRDHLREVIVTR